MRYRLAVFDWDGTLADTASLVYECSVMVFRAYGCNPPTAECFFEENIRSDFLDFYRSRGIPSDATRDDLNAIFKKHFVENMHDVKLRKGVVETLEFCREHGIRTALVSGSPAALEGVRKLQIAHLIEFAAVDCEGKHRSLRQAIETFEVAPEESLYLDDSVEGIMVSRMVGMSSVAIRDGFCPAHLLSDAKPDHLVTHVDELIPILKNGRSS